MRTCSLCHISKDLNEFQKDRSKKDGIRNDCKACCKIRKSKYYKKNREKVLAWCAEYHIKNRESKIARTIKWQKDNPERHAAKCARWNKANRGIRNANTARYRAKLKVQRCECCTDDDIKQLYTSCPKGYHVDHIYPISKGGLHCVKNLQHLTAEENVRKSDKVSEEYGNVK